MNRLYLFALLALLAQTGKAQSQRITLTVNDVSLDTVFARIQEQTPYRFVYTSEELTGTRKVSFSVQKASIEAVLGLSFKGQPLDYSMEDHYIYVRKKEGAVRDRTPGYGGMVVTGKVMNEKGEPLSSATISLKGNPTVVTSDEKGMFVLKTADSNAILVVSHIGYLEQEISLKGRPALVVVLKISVTALGHVEVTYSSGYQNLSPEKATGSYNLVDNELINRSVSTDILDRIENLVPGVAFAHGTPTNGTTTSIIIRGQSTIFGSTDPLIILDNFPYDGALSNINPNDIENITVLKDAAAASIWGARAGNGVIVITTKKGATNKPRVTFNSNVNFQAKPNLFNVNTISSSDYIDLEDSLYAKGYYAGNFTLMTSPAVTPVVQLLQNVDLGLISASDANVQIQGMKQHDVRNDEKKYFYQPAAYQQYAFNVSGNTPYVNYYMSAGWDHDLNNMISSKNDRFTMRALNTFHLTRKLDIDAGLNYVQANSQNGNNPGYNYQYDGHQFYPYAQLADSRGNPLPVNFVYNQSFLQGAQNAGLLNWQYFPVSDINNESNGIKTTDFTVTLAARYHICSFLNAEIKYQYENQLSNGNNLYDDSSFYTRNLINEYTQVGNGGQLTYPIPLGGILYQNISNLTSNQGRTQMNFSKSWTKYGQLSAIGGFEIRSLVTTSSTNQMYGYLPNSYTIQTAINYNTQYPFYGNPGGGYISNGQSISQTTDHFLSYYGNAAYTYGDRYIFSGSIRYDEANLFGVNTNEKGAPLYSLGAGWILSKESFYHLPWFDFLKFRATYGYNGNISRLTSALETATFNTANYTPAITARIQNPPNADLRWEKDGQVNFGADFITKGKIISGSIEYYVKHAKDLMGEAPIDPTLGLATNAGNLPTFYYGNVAGMEVHGSDIQLASRNLNGRFKWLSNFIFSYAASKVTKYLFPVSESGGTYVTASSSPNVSPITGKPLYAFYSYPFAGLDPNTGDPLGYFQGKSSNNYAGIETQIPLDSMTYSGSAQPVYYGAIRNTFSYKNVSLSCNISYKLGYYFRKNSYDGGLPTGWTLNGDYSKRWQQPGDEKHTVVPSLVYPANSQRQLFYDYSSVLMEKAGNIRLEDISISYDVDHSQWKSMPFTHIRLYLYGNLSIPLWLANKDHIDPYFNNVPTNGKSIALGLNISF